MSRSVEVDGREPDPRPRLQAAIDRTARGQPTISDLIDRLDKAGVRAVPSIRKSGRLNGMSYVIGGILVKGSDLGRAYTAQGLQKRLGVQYDPQRDQPRLIAAAERAREYLIKGVDRCRQSGRARRGNCGSGPHDWPDHDAERWRRSLGEGPFPNGVDGGFRPYSVRRD